MVRFTDTTIYIYKVQELVGVNPIMRIYAKLKKHPSLVFREQVKCSHMVEDFLWVFPLWHRHNSAAMSK